jgi:hypothetical protein
MDIRFVSSLTPEDENRLAPALLAAVGGLLDQFPVAYALRIETSGGGVFEYSRPTGEERASAPIRRPSGSVLRFATSDRDIP